MTDRQIEVAKRRLPNYFKDMTPAQRREYEELYCRGMINSCLVYGEARYNFYDPKTGEFGRYAKDYVKTLGEETVIRLYNEQCEDFSKAVVRRGVHVDGEGVSYNSCIWADDQDQRQAS